MRPHKLVACIVLAAVVMAGCSRLTFIKPKLERGEYTREAPEYNVREAPGEKKRVAAMDLVAAAEMHLRNGQVDQAETAANAALKADPASADAHTLLAMVAEQRGKAAEAGTHYARAMELAPARGGVLNNYGAWLCGNGRAAESLVLFDRALADPGYRTPGAALANAGSCALTAGQDARAERDLRRALQYDPDSPTALAALATLHYRAGDYMQARAFSERRLAAAPATPQVLQLASQIENKLGDTAAAARYVQRIRTEFPQARTPSGDLGQ
jgi:type IV pilus assembly protein PilF